jgi:predicted transcriptional regulator
MKGEKRSRIQICFDVLWNLREESKKNNKTCLTKVAHMANLPYDRFQKCLDNLIFIGMVSRVDNGEVLVTKKGTEFMDEYEKISDFLTRMGLLP